MQHKGAKKLSLMQLLHDYALSSDWLVPPPLKREKQNKEDGRGKEREEKIKTEGRNSSLSLSGP